MSSCFFDRLSVIGQIGFAVWLLGGLRVKKSMKTMSDRITNVQGKIWLYIIKAITLKNVCIRFYLKLTDQNQNLITVSTSLVYR